MLFALAELAGRNDLFHILDLNPSGAKVLGSTKQTIKVSSTIRGDDTLLVTADRAADDTGRNLDIEITAYDARVPAKLIQVQRAVVEAKRPDVWSSSNIVWNFQRTSWLSLGDGVGILAIPLRVEAWSRQNLKGNFDGYILYDVSRTAGISRRLNVSHVASEKYYNCYENKRLAEQLYVINGTITTTKGHSILATNLKTGINRWKLEITNSSVIQRCSKWNEQTSWVN